jgi:hypothetical protein
MTGTEGRGWSGGGIVVVEGCGRFDAVGEVSVGSGGGRSWLGPYSPRNPLSAPSPPPCRGKPLGPLDTRAAAQRAISSSLGLLLWGGPTPSTLHVGWGLVFELAFCRSLSDRPQTWRALQAWCSSRTRAPWRSERCSCWPRGRRTPLPCSLL